MSFGCATDVCHAKRSDRPGKAANSSQYNVKKKSPRESSQILQRREDVPYGRSSIKDSNVEFMSTASASPRFGQGCLRTSPAC
eukprot:4054653-Pleurochrysis_carterae.AAC.2